MNLSVQVISATKAFSIGCVVFAAASQLPARAFGIIPQPNAAYQSSTTLINLAAFPDFTNFTSITQGDQVVSFSTSMSKRTVPNTWSTWGSPPATESNTPAVAYNDGLNTLEIQLAKPSSIFGFEAEPNNFGVYPFSVNFYSGASLIGTINDVANGDAGAKLFAAMDTSNPFTRIVISTDVGAGGFAVGQLSYQSVPGPVPILGAAAAFRFSRRLRSKMKLSASLQSQA